MEKISKIHDATAVKKETKDSKNNNKGQSFKETLRLKMQEYEVQVEQEQEKQPSNITTKKISVKNVVPSIKKVDTNELKFKKSKDIDEK